MPPHIGLNDLDYDSIECSRKHHPKKSFGVPSGFSRFPTIVLSS